MEFFSIVDRVLWKSRSRSGPRRRARRPGNHPGRESRPECSDERRRRGSDEARRSWKTRNPPPCSILVTREIDGVCGCPRIRADAPPCRVMRPGFTERRPCSTRKEVSGHSEEKESRQEEGGKD